MKQFRQSLVNVKTTIVTNKASMRNSIARASTRFELADGVDGGQLKIENERLKTTILVLTQKLQA
jgi:hypothetical protein